MPSPFVNLIIAFLITTAINCEHHCWNENERAPLTFNNNPNKSVTHLPTIRLIQGYYPSQFAMQYLAFVYLAEKMGVDVTFYPDNDPNALFDRYSGYKYWCHTQNDANCSQYAPYPQFYFEDIKNDKYDLLFEIWDVMVSSGHGQEYYDGGSVVPGGMSNIYGESGWFVPAYIYETTPEWTLPKQLKENQTLRQIFIDAYTVDSDTDWLQKWYLANMDTLDTYNAKFDLPTNATPIIFGSLRGYAISDYSQRLTKNLLGGIDWHFVPFGSETLLTQFITELYSNQLPFIVNLYSPHLDFAIILNETANTEYMQFERIGLPRNPNNDVVDTCYAEGQCSFPLSPLLKIGNPKIQDQFYEIYNFLLDFSLTTNDLNDVIAYHKEVSSEPYNVNLTDHEMWVEATCTWLKDPDNLATLESWHQAIIRYDCIDFDNCGYDYYYESLSDAANRQNAIEIALYQSIGGYCLNSSFRALCECPYEEFGGDNCRQTCAGMIGPILQTNIALNELESLLNGSQKIIDVFNTTYSIFLCNGHGLCDVAHTTCKCELGFGGTECEIEYTLFQYDGILLIVWIFVFLLCLMVLASSIIWLWLNQQNKEVKALSLKMTTFFTVGLMLLCVGAVLYLFHPLNSAQCVIYYYCYGVGAILTIMSPLCKTARVAIIFTQAKQLKQISIPDKKLMLYLIFAVIFETLICVLYGVLHEMSGGVQVVYHERYYRTEYVCNQTAGVQYVRVANYILLVLLMVLLCYFGFLNRSTWKIFKESRCIYLGSFFSLFVFIVVIIFNLVTDDVFVVITIQCSAILIVVAVIWVLFYGFSIYKFYKKTPVDFKGNETTMGRVGTLSNISRKNTDISDMPSSQQLPPNVNDITNETASSMAMVDMKDKQ